MNLLDGLQSLHDDGRVFSKLANGRHCFRHDFGRVGSLQSGGRRRQSAALRSLCLVSQANDSVACKTNIVNTRYPDDTARLTDVIELLFCALSF